jgi:hypothetical protein
MYCSSRSKPVEPTSPKTAAARSIYPSRSWGGGVSR